MGRWASNTIGKYLAVGPDGDNVPEGGGGEAETISIPITHILPSGKTFEKLWYQFRTDDDSSFIQCVGCDGGLNEIPVILGSKTYLIINSGETTVGDYLRASTIVATGDIEVSGESAYVNGEGTLTITWAVA